MDEQKRRRRGTAVKMANAINVIRGVPVSEFACELSRRRIMGEITNEEMTAALLESHKRLVAKQSERET